MPQCRLEIAGKRGISAFKFRGIKADASFTHFEDKPTFDEVDVVASRYLDDYATGRLDRLDVVYTKFLNVARQQVTVETLLPLSAIGSEPTSKSEATSAVSRRAVYEFLPSPESILEEIVPASFKVKLFKCFLDAAVSEQVARMVAMKAATKAAGDRIRQLSMAYNRARQSQITGEIMEIIGGVEALNN